MGWVMFYAGITKVLNPEWSAAGYLENAQTFQGLYAWFAEPAILPFTNFINEWALTLLGISLILGIFVRLSSILGAVLMMLYYFPVLDFPRIPPHSYLIDDHVIYAIVLLVIGALHAGRDGGLDEWFTVTKFFKKHPKLREWLT
jgi:thiosulfate dehydrogenase [quinone] large subunit